jgi:RNA polymerase sigma factor (TIGR02999 family)
MTEILNTQVLIRGWRAGEHSARDLLIARLHPELEHVAMARLSREQNSSLSTGDLINEVIIRLVETERIELSDRTHLVALASRMMRNILIDHARLKNTDKRKHQKVELNSQIEGQQVFSLNALEPALIRLGAIDRELSDLVEMRYFGGMSLCDIGSVTGQSEATVKRRWHVARAWLADALINPITND